MIKALAAIDDNVRVTTTGFIDTDEERKHEGRVNQLCQTPGAFVDEDNNAIQLGGILIESDKWIKRGVIQQLLVRKRLMQLRDVEC